MHTSTVTVSVTDSVIKTSDKYNRRKENDYRIEWFSGTGKGGQHRNKRQNSCRIYHLPTGLVETCQGRKREANKREAMAVLNNKLDRLSVHESSMKLGTEKKKQKGSGMRGDKIRTYRFQDDTVKDHQTGRKAKCSKVLKGKFDLLW